MHHRTPLTLLLATAALLLALGCRAGAFAEPAERPPADAAERGAPADSVGEAELAELPAMTPDRRPEREAHQLAAGPPPRDGGTPLLAPPPDGLAEATFGGGCFWCTESDMQRIDGVDIAISGYTGGAKISPTYREVAGGVTSHVEAVRVFYDPAQVSYEQLLAVYWRHIDPTDDQGQFADRGAHYRPVIYVHDAEQRRLATASRDAVAASGRFDRPIVVAIEDAGDFWIAEEEHQNFYLERPAHYERYRRGSGRTRFIERTWGR